MEQLIEAGVVTRIFNVKRMLLLVDTEDAPRVRKYRWTVKPRKQTWYASTEVRGATVYMHRLIMGLHPGDLRVVDHIDNNGLNNRRCNLRIATNAQNTGRQLRLRKARTGYIGVEDAISGRFIARGRGEHGKVYLGVYDTAEQAARAYDAYQRAKLGEYARLNFPEGDDGTE